MVDIQKPTDFAFRSPVEPSGSFSAKMKEFLERAKHCMRIAQERQSRYANKKRRDLEFQVGDFALLE